MSVTIEPVTQERRAERGPERPAVAPNVAAPADEELPAGPVQVIEPRRALGLGSIVELWRFRELLYFLAWRDVKVRYKQTLLGAGWAILKPLVTVATFSLFFAFRFGEAEREIPYYLYCFAGLVPWIYFSTVVATAASSVVGNSHLFTKVAFPRLLLPLSAVGECLVDFLIAFATLGLFMVLNKVPLRLEVLLVPVVFLGLTIGSLGVGILLSALTVVYRDFRHLVPFLITIWLFLTPIAFMDPKQFFVTSDPATNELFEQVMVWIPLNPAYGLVENFRLALLGASMTDGAINWHSFWIGMGVSAALLPIGLWYFRRVERTFADVI